MPAASPVAYGTLPCPACAAPLDPAEWGHWREASCPRCRTTLHGAIFPAWSRPDSQPAGTSDRAAEGEAVCFFHPANRAALTCDRCGRFLCAICDMPVGARHLCPSCLSSGIGQEKLPEIVPWRFLWAPCAFWLGVGPTILALFMWPMLVVTGATAILVALIGWKRPGSLPRGRQRGLAIAGLVFGLVQVALWFGLIALIVSAGSAGGAK